MQESQRTLTRSLLAREYAVPQPGLVIRAASVRTFMTRLLERLEDRSSEQTCSVIPSQRLLLQISQVGAADQKPQSLAF